VSRRFPWSITGSSLPSVAGRIQENLCRCGTLNTFMTQVTARSTAAVDHAATAWCGLLGMAWSTREIAELAGTSLRAVRHYHEVGLLAEPERRANGYKQYGVAHLVRVLRIKRLTDLGFSLSQIAAMGDSDDHPEEALHALDAELAATIERLQRIRVELGLIMRQALPTDLPAEFAPAARAEMSEADRSLITVMTRVLGPAPRQAYADLLQNPSDSP